MHLLYMVFIMLKCFLYACFLKNFIISGYWILSKAFFASIEMVSVLQFVIWCITLTDLQILKIFCILGKNPSWSWYVIFLMYYWIPFDSILLRILASMFISNTGWWFSFFSFCDIFDFGIRVILDLKNDLGNVPSLAVFWKSFRSVLSFL